MSTSRAVRSQSTVGHAEIRVVPGVFRHLRERSRLEPQVHFERDGTPQRVDHFHQPQPPRFGGNPLGLACGKGEGVEVELEPPLDSLVAEPSPRPRAFIWSPRLRPDAPARWRRLRPAGQTRANDARSGLPSAASTARTAASLREWRHLVLQGFKIARQGCPDHVRPRRQKLAELHITGTKPRQARWPGGLRRRAARRTFDQSRNGDQPRVLAAATCWYRSMPARPRARTRNQRARGGQRWITAAITIASRNAARRSRRSSVERRLAQNRQPASSAQMLRGVGKRRIDSTR